MKNLLILSLLALVSTSAQARHGQDDGFDHDDNMIGCEVKINGMKLIQRQAVVGVPVQVDTPQFSLNMSYSAGRLFQATLLDKASGDTLALANDGSGNVLGSLRTDEPAAPVQLMLPVGAFEIYGTSASGDNIKLERDVRGPLSKAELSLRSNEVPASLVKFECKY